MGGLANGFSLKSTNITSILVNTMKIIIWFEIYERSRNTVLVTSRFQSPLQNGLLQEKAVVCKVCRLCSHHILVTSRTYELELKDQLFFCTLSMNGSSLDHCGLYHDTKHKPVMVLFHFPHCSKLDALTVHKFTI